MGRFRSSGGVRINCLLLTLLHPKFLPLFSSFKLSGDRKLLEKELDRE